jgi:hypothetical protein
VELVVDLASLERTSAGTVGGRVWLRDGDAETQGDFPEVGWLDFPMVVLATWLPALQKLARTVPSTSAEAECHFFDGPYHVTVQPETPSVWKISCYESRASRSGGTTRPRPVQRWRTSAASFQSSVWRAGHALLAHFDAKGWWDRDTEALRRALENAQPHVTG